MDSTRPTREGAAAGERSDDAAAPPAGAPKPAADKPGTSRRTNPRAIRPMAARWLRHPWRHRRQLAFSAAAAGVAFMVSGYVVSEAKALTPIVEAVMRHDMIAVAAA